MGKGSSAHGEVIATPLSVLIGERHFDRRFRGVDASEPDLAPVSLVQSLAHARLAAGLHITKLPIV